MTGQLSLLPAMGARCGYCERELVRRGSLMECSRCAPLLRDLGRGLSFDGVVAAFARFQRDAR
jgi:hypothetical protein